MAIDFPASPINGQVFITASGAAYKWSGVGWYPQGVATPGLTQDVLDTIALLVQRVGSLEARVTLLEARPQDATLGYVEPGYIEPGYFAA